jgi:hypothetical protein
MTGAETGMLKSSDGIFDITGRSQCYVPYAVLEKSPITLRFGKVPIHLVQNSPSTCLISVSVLFLISDSDFPGKRMSVTANLGTSFLLSYMGVECEVRLGRRITILDTNTYIHH